MPLSVVQLDASGTGYWNSPLSKLESLSVINQSGGAVTWYSDDASRAITLQNNLILEYEEQEAAGITTLNFTKGPANGSVTVSWD